MSAAIVLGGLVAAAPAFAGGATGNDLRVSPAASNPATIGSSFTVNVISNTTGATSSTTISGATASLVFDKTKLQVTAITGGSDWTTAGASAVGWNPANTSTNIAYANANGKVGNGTNGAGIGFTFLDGASNLSAADHILYSVTFTVGGVNCDVSSLSLPIGATDGGLSSGDAADYGAALSVTSTAGTVNNPCPTAPPPPTPTPLVTPTPSLAPANGTVNVTGSLDQGFLSLQCPDTLGIPLIRNATNIKDFQCTVFSNILWNLGVTDAKAPAAHTGFMTSGSNTLANPMHVANIAASIDVNLVSGGTVASGSNSVNQALELQQFVGPADVPNGPGSPLYGINLVFQATSGF